MRLTPALQDLYSDAHRFIVVQKAAQVFATEYMINGAIWVADTGQGSNGTALYVMPTQAQVNDFSQARVDRAIGESAYLHDRTAPPPPSRPGPSRQALKKIGDGYVYFRGGDAKQLISVPADAVYLDEFDLMSPEVLPRAMQRLGASTLGLVRVASTPRFPEAGVNALFLDSDQRYYFLKCPACGLTQRLEWDHNVDQKRGVLVCRSQQCRRPLDLWAPGGWEATAPGNERHGYNINRLYSPLANIPQLIYESQETTPAAMQEFQNSVLGQTFVPPGGKLSFADLDACRREYTLPQEQWADLTDMGVDVGTKLHTIIRTHGAPDAPSRLLFAGEVDSFDDLDRLMKRFNVDRVVIDAQPEGHGAREFARRYPYKVWVSYYDRDHGDHVWERRQGELVNTVHVNRTDALEAMFERVRAGKVELPQNARHLGGRVRDGFGEYYREMTALNRVLEENARENWVGRYVNGGKADHYAHGEAYCLLANQAYRGAKLHKIRRF